MLFNDGKKIMSVYEDPSLLERLASVQKAAVVYFKKCVASIGPPPSHFSAFDSPWKHLPKALWAHSERISAMLTELAHAVGPAIRRSPLLTEADEREIGHLIKGMRATLRFKKFVHWDTDVIHDGGQVLGVRRAGESSDENIPYVEKARGIFNQFAESLKSRLQLINPVGAETRDVVSMYSTQPIAAGHRPGTAFIMMWFSKDHVDLIDVSTTVKRCFAEFGIVAVRSDDIEHADIITSRILDQIKTAEFLFADLTGERPSVYYEIGYAHALGRPVIMFRKAGTPIHFDLAAYNCPEYKNLTELEEILIKRLEAVTGKKSQHK